MKAFVWIPLLFIFSFLSAHDPLSINIFSVRNGKGLEKDQNILAQELHQLGCITHCYDFERDKEIQQADINVFFQVVKPQWFSRAKVNWFVPNPEWYWQDIDLLKDIDLILCRTKEVQRIFNELNIKTYFLGFTSKDCYDPLVQKDFSNMIHVAGGSAQKGTMPIIKSWIKNSDFPFIRIIKWRHRFPNKYDNLQGISTRIPPQKLSRWQNACGVHLCLSETEGFGHYLMEAMSTRAVVVTTNAPPMNEFITDFLVPYKKSDRQALGINYYVDENKLQDTIRTIMATPYPQLREIGNKNRKMFALKTREFRDNLRTLISEYDDKKNQSNE